MYSYTFDSGTGGIILNSTPTHFSKEPRPVYAPEMDTLGFDRYWDYEKQNDIPYLWAESNIYWYRGVQIAKTKGGDLYTAPELHAVQAVGHVEINVHELDVDFLSASAHKFNGPKGIGFLYIRKGIELPPYQNGGAQESMHRAGTENVAAIVGMAKALYNNCSSMTENRENIENLEKQLISELNRTNIPYIRNGGDDTLPGLLSLSFPRKDGEAILHRMDLMGISISTGAACNSVNTEISHVLRTIQVDDIVAKGTIRVSLGKNNTKEDIENIVVALTKILTCLR